MMGTSPLIDVHALVCHSAVEMARRGFTSLMRCSDRPLRFIVHDDGSLQSEDCERLEEALPGTTFIERGVADAIVDSRLATYARCRELRRLNPLALKLLDIPLLAEGEDVACCDTDVLAFRPFSGLFEWPNAQTTGLFMPDTQNAYAMRPWHLVASGIALPMYVNTGLMLFRTRHHDLDFIEWFLERQFRVYRRLPGWIEQTAWAALAQRGTSCLFDAGQVRVVRDTGCLSDEALLIGHFTANVRGLWERAVPAAASPDPAATIRTLPTERLSPARLAAEQVRRLANRSRTWIPQRAQ